MRQRAIIAMALALKSKLIILDEPTTALDVIVQAQVLDWIREVQKKLDLALILVTHDLSVIAKVCTKIAIFYAGKIVEQTDVTSLFERPVHPYSQGLMRSFPSIRGPRRPWFPFRASLLISLTCLLVPVSFPLPIGQEMCRTVEPQMVEIERGHLVACHAPGGIC